VNADETPIGFVLVADELCGTRENPDPNCTLCASWPTLVTSA